MDTSDLLEIERIKLLKHRYMRAVDTQDVELLWTTLAEDVSASYSGGTYVVTGRQAICDFVESMIDTTAGCSHIAVHPEITLDTSDRASGIWRLEDTVNFTQPNPHVSHVKVAGGDELQGAGYYLDRYVKRDGEWLILYTSYERLYERVARLTDLRIEVPSTVALRQKIGTALSGGPAGTTTQARVSHFGICVSDLDRAASFYCGALGFRDEGGIRLENEQGNVLGLDDFVLVTRNLTLGPVRIELLHFPRSRGATVATEPRPMNYSGLTHIAIAVPDVDAAADAVLAHGGRVFSETRSTLESPTGAVELLYASDPDFTRIELIRYPSGG